MKTIDIDAINPVTGEPFSWDDPNVFSGDPGYCLEPGDPGYVPYPEETDGLTKNSGHGGLVPLCDLVGSESQSAGGVRSLTKYRYGIARRSDGGFSTSPFLADAFDDDTVDSAVADATGLPEQKCAEVLAAYMDQLFMSAAGNRWAHAIHNLLTKLPGSAAKSSAACR